MCNLCTTHSSSLVTNLTQNHRGCLDPKTEYLTFIVISQKKPWIHKIIVRLQEMPLNKLFIWLTLVFIWQIHKFLTKWLTISLTIAQTIVQRRTERVKWQMGWPLCDLSLFSVCTSPWTIQNRVADEAIATMPQRSLCLCH